MRLLAMVGCFLLPVFFNSALAQVRSYLTIDPLRHHGVVNKVLYVPELKEIVSVSDDKTIRFWDAPSSSLTRTLRVYSEPGPLGMLYAADFEASGQLLAVGGYSPSNEIYLIGLETSEVSQTLKGHENVISSLAFFRGGEYLLSGSSDRQLLIWKKTSGKNYSLSQKLQPHNERISSIAVSPLGTHFVTGSSDGTVAVFSFDQGQLDVKLEERHLGGVTTIDFASNGKYFISGDDKGLVNLWDTDGNLLKVISNKGSNVYEVVITPDSKKVIVSSSSNEIIDILSGQAIVIDIPSNVSSVGFISDEIGVVAAGPDGDLYLYDFASNRVESIFGSPASRTWNSLLINQSLVGMYAPDADIGISASFGFDLGSFELTRDKERLRGLAAARHDFNGFRLTKVDPMTLNIGVSGLVKNSTNIDGRVLSYTVIDDSKVAVGSDLSLKVYDGKGSLLKTLEGHNGQVVSLVSNKDYLVSYGSDQIVKFWKLPDFEHAFNLYVSPTFEWIVWANDGLYESSAGGERYLGYQVNNGFDQLARFVDVSTFRGKLHTSQFQTATKSSSSKAPSSQRESGSDQMPGLYPTIKWLSPTTYSAESDKKTIRIKAIVESAEPIQSVKILVDGRPMAGERNVFTSGGAGSMVIEHDIVLPNYENEIQIFASTGEAKIVSEKRKVTCSSCAPEFKESSYHLYNASLPDKYHLLSIGISEFQNPKFNLSYAEADAASIFDVFETKGNEGAIQLHAKQLVNHSATKANVLQSIQQLTEQAGAQDITVVFIASHGFNVENEYHILTHDSNESDLSASSISWSDLAGSISGIQGKVLLIIDTCHSGNLGLNLSADASFFKNTDALREASSNDFGLVIMASSTGSEASLESDEWKHGAFTKSILEGIGEGRADIRKDGTIFLRELDLYVSERVFELTNGKQNPTTQKPSTISKFPVFRN